MVGTNEYIGAFSYIGNDVKIGDHVKIYPNVYIGDNTVIGANCTLFPGVKIYSDTQIGNDCKIHSGAIIGADGFGFAPDEHGVFQAVPQIGNVVIEDQVDIGAGTTIDRATLGSTIIGKGVKIRQSGTNSSQCRNWKKHRYSISNRHCRFYQNWSPLYDWRTSRYCGAFVNRRSRKSTSKGRYYTKYKSAIYCEWNPLLLMQKRITKAMFILKIYPN